MNFTIFFGGKSSSKKREKKTGKGRGQFYTRDCNTFETIHNLSSDRAAVGNERGVTAAAAAALARGAGRQGGGEVVLRNAQSPSRRRPRGQSWVRGGRRDDGVKVTEGMVLFWRAPSCFAQWTPAEFEIDNVVYCNAEQWMMASKAKLFGDNQIRDQIMRTKDPRQHKALGREVRNFSPEIWEVEGFDLVVKGNLAKFQQNEHFKNQLLATGDKILAEASPYDKVWGIGLSADDPRALVQRKWQGENKLGEALMDVRRQLKEDMYDADTAGDADAAGRGGDTSDDYDMGSFDENDTIGKHRL